MYLSRVKLNLAKRETMIALSAPQRFHGAVERSIAVTGERHLWRLDSLKDQTYMLILSATKPDLSGVQSQFGYDLDATSAQTVVYDKLLERVTEGSKWHFRLVANPVRSVFRAEGRGKVMNHLTVDQQQAWLLQRSSTLGFSLVDGEFAVVGSKWHKFQKKDKNRVSILAVAFEGVLTVTNVELFRQALLNGIGRGKAYGLGLLTIVR